MKKAFLFPGYGSQHVGMAKDLYDESRIIQEYFEEASNCLDTNFVKLCFAASESDISRMSAAYPAIFLVSCALYAMLRERAIIPDIVIGYNTGDYAALYAAQSITFPDGLYLLNKYAQQYQQFLTAGDFATVAINGIRADVLQAACKKVNKQHNRVTVSICHTEQSVVMGGTTSAITMLRDQVCAQKSVKCSEPGLAVELHSAVMNSVVDTFKMYLEKVDFKDPSITCMNSQAQILSSGSQIKSNIIQRIIEPVYFNRVIDALIGYDLIVQIGPGSHLSSLVKEKYPDKIVLTVQSKEDFDALSEYISKGKSDTETTNNDS